MVTVPHILMYSINSVPKSFVQKFSGFLSTDEKAGPTSNTTVHCILAAYLTHGEPEDLQKYNLWKESWPARKDFEDSMPIMWPRGLVMSQNHNNSNENENKSINFLPPSISGRWNTIIKSQQDQAQGNDNGSNDGNLQNLLGQQQRRLKKDWEHVLAVFPDTNWEIYSYHWLIVNTRCFFYLLPGDEPPEDQNDAMALVPLADYFNHSSDGSVC